MRKIYVLLLSMMSMLVSQQALATAVTANRYTYFEEDNVWVLFSDDAELMFRLGLKEVAVSGKSYEWADMNQAESRVINSNNKKGWMDSYKAATFVYTKDGEGHISLSLKAQTAAHGEYEVSYGEVALEKATDTVDIAILNATFEEQLAFYSVAMFGQNEQYAVRIKCNVNKSDFLGEYEGLGIYNEYGKIDKDNSGLWRMNGTDSVAVKLVYAKVVLTAVGANYRMQAYLQDDQRHGYQITMQSVPLAALDTIYMTSKNLEVFNHTDLEKPQTSFAACDDKLCVSIWVYGDGANGEYKGSEIASCSIYSREVDSEWGTLLQYGLITISGEGDSVHISGEMLMDDNNRYMLELSTPYVKPTPGPGPTPEPEPEPEPVDVKLESGDLVVEDQGGVMAWQASCSGYLVYMMIESGEYEGVFPASTWVSEQCYAGEEKSGMAYYFEEGSVTIEMTELGSYWMHGVVTAHDGSKFELDLLSAAGIKYDAQREDYEAYFSVSEVTVNDSKWADYGGLTLLCQNRKNQVAAISFVCDKDSADADILLPLGEYQVNSSKEPYTVTPSIGVFGEVFSSFAGTISTNGIEYPVWLFEDGVITVSKENGEPRVTVAAINSCFRKINIQIGGKDPQGLEQTAAESNGTVIKRLVNGMLVIETENGVFNIFGTKIQ